ncbi:hypothetical protein [Mesorhizobium prunaredense]|uniref:hypothetical protein n=1 Tax=Mesorhizobium prunaredense TaxID=1631249 RepID=UPI000987ABE9|nr:hypothetical protein [Mesorhizobium prunaredense]
MASRSLDAGIAEKTAASNICKGWRVSSRPLLGRRRATVVEALDRLSRDLRGDRPALHAAADFKSWIVA